MTVDIMHKSIYDTFLLATPDQIETGVEWYMRGNFIIRDIQEETGLSMERIAAIMAALSPRISWTANVKGTWCMALGLPILAGMMGRSWDMGLAALNSDNPLEIVKGPKTSRFAKNLLLIDMRAVTVDVWALRAAGVEDLDVSGSRKGLSNYLAVEKAYQDVADKLGIIPAHLQAICWVVAKSHYKRKTKK